MTQPQPAEIHEHVDVTAAVLTPTREASGTAWLPATTPMYGLHRPWRGWDVRLNGVVAAAAVYEPGDRHRTGGSSTRQGIVFNWGMATARRALGAGRLGIRTMLSAEPLTVRGCGSLNFLDVGEVCDNDTIHDRQQPHDLIMELAADYDRPIGRGWRWQVYGGVAGEPALGPPGYSHRPSAIGNPIAPITHHGIDAIASTFGVVTAAAHDQRWKAEASIFNGREADDRRVDLDFGAFDSFAARVSLLASSRLVLQVSGGQLRDALTDFYRQPQNRVSRVTASATYVKPTGGNGTWATTAAYAMNSAHELIAGSAPRITTHSGLLESSATIADRHTLFGRLEILGMPAHHLHAFEFRAAVFATGKLQAGYVHHLRSWKGVVPGLGLTSSLSVLPAPLAPRYSGRIAASFGVFFEARPVRHAM